MISKIILIILFTLMVFNGVYNQYKMQDDIAKQNAFQVVSNFVNNVRTKGYISPTMIEDFERDLQLGSYLFKTEFKHQKKVYTPVYTDPTNPASFTGEYVVDMDEYYKTQIMDYLFEEPNSIPKAERKYLMTEGDFFYVEVQNMTRSNAMMLFDAFTNNTEGDGVFIFIPNGGMILNEDF